MRQDELGVVRNPKGVGLYWKYGLPTIVIVTVIIVGFAFFPSLATWSVAGLIGLVGAVYGIKNIPPAVFNSLIMLEKWRQEKIATNSARIAQFIRETPSGVIIVNDGGKTIAIEKFYAAVSAAKEYGDIPLLPESTTPKYRNLLDIDFVHLLIVGPSGSGKSTAMCHLIDNSNAICYVLDPHKKQNENKGLIWPANSLVIGDGRDWQAIDNKLVELLEEMDRRYKPNAGNFGKILIFADEWLSILAKCPHAKEFFETIGSEARKVDIHLVIGTISQTVDDLGVSAAIRDNLTQVNLNQTWKDQNLAQITWSRGEKEMVELPGKYRARLLPSNLDSKSVQEPIIDEPLPELDDGPTIYSPTQDELKIYELWLQNKKLRPIWEEVYGTSFGGNQANQLKEILAKFGVV